MKVTNRNSKDDAGGKHNDRNFDVDSAEHIDQSRMGENIYWTYNGDNESTFKEIELDFYEKHFGDKLDEQNQKHKKGGHKSRMKTMSKYYRSKRTRPEDKILQIGDAIGYATKEELWDCVMEYKDKFDEMYGENCVILDMALHMDESTPHVHVRRVWIAVDEETGWEYVSERQALEQIGMPRPWPDKPESKYNNPKIMITQNETEMFRQICIERGLDIESPKEKGTRQKHLSMDRYKVEKSIKLYTAIKEFSSEFLEFIRDYPKLMDKGREKINEVENAEDEPEKLNPLLELMKILIQECERLYRLSRSKTRFLKKIGKFDEWQRECKSGEKPHDKGDGMEI